MPTKTPAPTTTHQIIFMPSGRRGPIPHQTTLLDAAQQLGIQLENVCGGKATCVKCKLQVEEGTFQKLGIHSTADHLSAITEKELSTLGHQAQTGYRLACQTEILGDCLLTVPESSLAHRQIIRKSASEKVIAIQPALKQIYVEVEQARTGEHSSDWDRLQTALHAKNELNKNLQINITALRNLQNALRQEKWTATITIWQNQEVIDVQPGYTEGLYGLAVDIGTTTIAAYLCDLRTGEILATTAAMNPQIKFGEDLMSRISYINDNPDGLTTLNQAVIDTINQLAAQAAEQCELTASRIQDLVVVGNTTMIHIFLGINPQEIGKAPFALALRQSLDTTANSLGLQLHPAAKAHILPAQAGHIGADNTAVILAEDSEEHQGNTLIIDVGTNAEIVLKSNHVLYSASSPTGPAFEGGQIKFGMRAAPGAIERVRINPDTKQASVQIIGEEQWSQEWNSADKPAQAAIGICGSGIIEAVAEMYLTAIIGADGRFIPDEQCDQIIWDGNKPSYILVPAEFTVNNEPILITQKDVRNVQLAKGALYTGARLLMDAAEIDTLDQVILAGAFGSYIDPKYALVLGLFPSCDLNHIYAVGNAAGDGARIALLDAQQRIQAEEIARQVNYIETATHKQFQSYFIDALNIPHKADPFPNLEGILPDTKKADTKQLQT